MNGPDVCRVLAWDSEFFGRRIARLTARRLDPALADEAVTWGKRHGIDCLYFLADADDPETAILAEAHGFRQVDVRLTLERPLEGPPAAADTPDIVVRAAVAGDRAALRALARVSHRESRFYQDPAFPRSRCDDLYERWIDNSLNGEADAVLVIDHRAAAVGYVSCQLRSEEEGAIDLLAVSARYQGRGWGRALLGASLSWFTARGRRRVSVVTQGRNARARRLYEAGGFTTRGAELWYHRWFQ